MLTSLKEISGVIYIDRRKVIPLLDDRSEVSLRAVAPSYEEDGEQDCTRRRERKSTRRSKRDRGARRAECYGPRSLDQ